MILQSHCWAYIQRKPEFETTPMFIAALFTIARAWKQPKCPLIEEWIKKMWYIYTMEYYSAIRKNEIMPFVTTQMSLEIITKREVGRKAKDL